MRKEKYTKNWEFFLSSVIFWIITIILLINSLILNQGHLIYALDDTYIHLAIAKNFSQYGVWGVSKYEFSSSSSSLFYTLLLSLIFLLFGPNEIIPFIINVISANLLIYQVYYLFKEKYNLPSYAIFIALLLLIFFLPLHSLIFIGMEHIIQTIFNIFFVFFSINVVSSECIFKSIN